MFLKALVSCHAQGYVSQLKGTKRKVTTAGVLTLLYTTVNDCQHPMGRVHEGLNRSVEEAYRSEGQGGFF